MKKCLCLAAALCLCVAAWAEEPNCDVKTQTPLKLMEQELTRGFKTLRKQKPPVYYLSYIYTAGEEEELTVFLGGVAQEAKRPVYDAEVTARAGSPEMDNTRVLKGERADYSVGGWVDAPAASIEDPRAFKRAWWRATQEAAEKAQKNFSRVAANVRTMSERKDKSADFVFPPEEQYCLERDFPAVDLQAVKPLLLKASELAAGSPYVLDSSFQLTVSRGHRYFADSRGTRLKTPYSFIRLVYTFSNRTDDGMELSRAKIYDVASVNDLPSEEQLLRDVRQSLAEMEALAKAPEGEPYTAPAILKGKAAAVFVHEVLGHRLEGHRQKNDAEGQTFTGKVGQRVISPLISVTDDPTQTEFNGEPLRGHYEYDDEGVKSAPVTLIENGVLKNFLMPSSPIEGFAKSNAHGRKERGKRAVARMGVLRATASETVPYDELEKMLVQEIKRQGKPYGFIIEDLGGGFTLTETDLPQTFKLSAKLVYRVYPDGRKEAVRGLDVVGTPLVSFNKILAAGDDDELFNGSCGAESGWVPQSNIAPSLLFESLETEKAQKGALKAPVLSSPLIRKGAK